MYYGWSHDDARMQMMDLPQYLDSFRLGYERALADLQSQLASLTQAYMPGAYAPMAPAPPPAGRGAHEHGGRHWHEHGDRHHHDHHDCGCDCDDCSHSRGCRGNDCRCECCIVDADYVVYARCFERRVVPIEIANDTRKVREDVTLEVSDVRSAGGRVLPWRVTVRPESPLTLPPCSTTEIDLRVDIVCGDGDDNDNDDEGQGDTKASGTRKATRAQAAEAASRTDVVTDVDECEVGYVTIRVDGCLIRPIVVAIAVLPRSCDAYHAGCSCSCCR
jgi:hypothetical protein